MAVRNPQGEIVLEKWDTKTAQRPKFFRLPLVRGIVGFVDSMIAGYKCLMRSAEISGLEELEEERKAEKKAKEAKKGEPESSDIPVEEETIAGKEESAPATPDVPKTTESGCEEPNRMESEIPEKESQATVPEKQKEKKEKSSPLMTGLMIVSTVLGVGLSVLLFIMLPSFLYEWSAKLMPFLRPESKVLTSLVKSAFEGILKIAILVAYMALVTLMKDIRRTFQYHGAEHKTIFCYEHGQELTVENVRRERRFHPRCGTSFLILMLIVGMFISFFIDPLFLATLGYIPHTFIRVLIRILLLPLVMGIGYELIKLAGRHDNLFTRIISAPGMWLQHITVLEPTDDMIECAITAFREVIPEDESDQY